MRRVVRIKTFMHVIGVRGGAEKHRQNLLFLLKRRGRQALDGKRNRPDIPFASMLTSNSRAKLPAEIVRVVFAEKKTARVFIDRHPPAGSSRTTGAPSKLGKFASSIKT